MVVSDVVMPIKGRDMMIVLNYLFFFFVCVCVGNVKREFVYLFLSLGCSVGWWID